MGVAEEADGFDQIFAGDLMLDDGPGKTIATGGDPLFPFAAILAGRQTLRPGEFALPALIAIAAYVVALLAHPWIAGVPALP